MQVSKWGNSLAVRFEANVLTVKTSGSPVLLSEDMHSGMLIEGLELQTNTTKAVISE